MCKSLPVHEVSSARTAEWASPVARGIIHPLLIVLIESENGGVIILACAFFIYNVHFLLACPAAVDGGFID